MADSYHFEAPEHFTAGTVGPKGQRIFYLQFGVSGELVTLRLEKAQVQALAEYLEHLLEDLDDVAPDEIPLALDLIEPIQPAWTVASIGVAFQDEVNQFVVVVEELLLDEDADEDDASNAQIHLSAGQVKAFIDRARDLVASGRPPCTFCGRPLDGTDNWCPCHN